MTIILSVTNENGDDLGFADIPVHCQADDCESFVDSDMEQFKLYHHDWSFAIWLWLCPRHVGMAVVQSVLYIPD